MNRLKVQYWNCGLLLKKTLKILLLKKTNGLMKALSILKTYYRKIQVMEK